MKKSCNLAIIAAIGTLSACAAPSGTGGSGGNTASSAPAPSTSGARVVKSKDGRYDGEIVGTPAASSKFAKLQIGMTMREVTTLIGAPDDMIRHETGKRWIPLYFGNDAQRLQVLYKGEGCLTYTGGNVFGGGGNELLRITVDPKGACLES